MPFDASTETVRPARIRPRSLKLEFSKAADYPRINALFDPDLKKTFDPKGYVARRLEPAFRKAVDEGAAVFLSDENNEVQALTIAYRCHVGHPGAPNDPPDYTEYGTSLSRFGGFNSAQLVVAALALREWWVHPPRHLPVALIKNSNAPSIKTYRDALGWRPVTDADHIRDILTATDKTLADDKDKGAPLSPDSQWYSYDDAAIARLAGVILHCMDQGGLHNKRTGETIPVDFSALDQIGLTRARLETLARGNVQRPQPNI